MRKLNDTETYSGGPNFVAEVSKSPQSKQDFDDVFKQGYISPKLLEYDLDMIKRVGYVPEAIKLLNDNKMVLLNTQVGELRANLSIRIPFFMVGDTMYVNAARFGKWSADKSSYSIMPTSELAPILQSSYLVYLFMKNQDKLLKDPKIIELLTRIYVDYMVQLLKSFDINLSDTSADDNITYIRYLTCKFFLIHILGITDDIYVSELAFKISKNLTNKISLDVLRVREEGDGFIDDTTKYGTLSGFIAGIMDATESSHSEIGAAAVLTKMSNLYGEQTYHSIEYLPYLLYFISLVMKNASLRKLRNKIMSMSVLKNFFLKLEQEILAKSTNK